MLEQCRCFVHEARVMHDLLLQATRSVTTRLPYIYDVYFDALCRMTMTPSLEAALQEQSATKTAAISRSLALGTTTQLLADYDETGKQLRDVPVGMEPPAKRPISNSKWSHMVRDSLRPEAPEMSATAVFCKRGWVRKAVGRPPMQNWDQKVWLFIQEDRLYWLPESDMGTATSTLSSQRANAPARDTIDQFPSAAAGIGMPSAKRSGVTHAATGGKLATGSTLEARASAAANSNASWPPLSAWSSGIAYLPLDRLPVRGTPRGYVPGTSIARVSDSQVVVREKIGTAFAVTCGSHTHFFAAESESEADAWVAAIKQAWMHCAMHTTRRSDWTVLDTARRSEAFTAASIRRLTDEKLQIQRHFETVHSQRSAELASLRGELETLRRRMAAGAVYEVKVVTSDRKGAQTNSRVYVQLFGAQPGACSPPNVQLAMPPGRTKKAPFKRGCSSTFEIKSEELGDVAEVLVWSDFSGSKPDWHVASLHVRRKPPASEAETAPWTDFWAHRWLSGTLGDRKLMVRLYANQPAVERHRCGRVRHFHAYTTGLMMADGSRKSGSAHQLSPSW